MKEKIKGGDGVVVASWLVITLIDVLSATDRRSVWSEEVHATLGELIGSMLFLLFAVASIKMSTDREERIMWVLFVISVACFIVVRVSGAWFPAWAYWSCSAVTFGGACIVALMKAKRMRDESCITE